MTIYYISLFIIAIVVIQFIRFKLTRWENIVAHYESEKRSDSNAIYGYWSEFRQSPKSYPLSNSFLKLIPTNYGLYLQYDLKYEPIKYYKPVMIPWSNIRISQTKELFSNGGEEYIIEKNDQCLGSIFLQFQISEQIKDNVKNYGVELNYV